MPKEDYLVTKRIGQGAQGSVYEVRHTLSHDTFAMKKIDVSHLSEKEKQSALQEVRVLATLQQHPHPYVMGYKESFVDAGEAMLCLVLEWSSEGSLEDRFDRDKDVCHPAASSSTSHPPPPPLTENEVWRVFLSIALALDHVHGLRILHRDVKMANVFLHSNHNVHTNAVVAAADASSSTATATGPSIMIADDKGPLPRSKRKTMVDRVQLGDFGVSTILKDRSNAMTMVGTPYYFSPELCMGKAYSSKSDVWSLGVLLFTMLHNRMPFEANNYGALILRIVQQTSVVMPVTSGSSGGTTAKGSSSEGLDGYAPILSKLCGWALQKKEASRPTARDLICHPACLAKAMDLGLKVPNDVLQNQAVMGAMLTRAGRLRIPPKPTYVSTAPNTNETPDATRPSTSAPVVGGNVIPLRKGGLLHNAHQIHDTSGQKRGWDKSSKPAHTAIDQTPARPVTSSSGLEEEGHQTPPVIGMVTKRVGVGTTGPGAFKKERPRGGCGGTNALQPSANNDDHHNRPRPIVLVAAPSADPYGAIRTVKHKTTAHAKDYICQQPHHPPAQTSSNNNDPLTPGGTGSKLKASKGDIESVRDLPESVVGRGERRSSPLTKAVVAQAPEESAAYYLEAVAQSFSGVLPPTASHRVNFAVDDASHNLQGHAQQQQVLTPAQPQANPYTRSTAPGAESEGLEFSSSGGYERIRFSTPRDLTRYLRQQQMGVFSAHEHEDDEDDEGIDADEDDRAVSDSSDAPHRDGGSATQPQMVRTFRPGAAFYDEKDEFEDVPLRATEEVVEDTTMVFGPTEGNDETIADDDESEDEDEEGFAAVTWKVGDEVGTASGDMISSSSHRPSSAKRAITASTPAATIAPDNRIAPAAKLRSKQLVAGALPPRPSSATIRERERANATGASSARKSQIPAPVKVPPHHRPNEKAVNIATTVNSMVSSVASHDNIPISMSELTGGTGGRGSRHPGTNHKANPVPTSTSGAVVMRGSAVTGANKSSSATASSLKKAMDELILTSDASNHQQYANVSRTNLHSIRRMDLSCGTTTTSVASDVSTVEDTGRLREMLHKVEQEGASVAGLQVFIKVSDAVRASSEGGGPLLTAMGKDSAKVFLGSLGVKDETKQAMLMHLAFRSLFLQGQLSKVEEASA